MNDARIFNKCTGCSACVHSCSYGAIRLEIDDEGFYAARIDMQKCVDCGICRNVCPIENAKNDDIHKYINAYAAHSKSKQLRMESSSGGIFTAVAAAFIKKYNGTVFGVWLNEDKDAMHIPVNSVDCLYKLRGSKYIQSNTNTAFKEIKDLLISGEYVLFSGTPCQVSGLKNFLGKDYYNLFTIDLICHGIPSPGLFKDYVKFLEKKYNKISQYMFRQKNDKSNGQSYDTKIVFRKNNKEKIKTICGDDDVYTINFLENKLQNKACFECVFASLKRYGDITLGDYWGVEDVHKELEGINGVSLVLENTDKGKNLLDIANEDIVLIETSEKNILNKNFQLKEPPKMNPYRSVIYKNYKKTNSVTTSIIDISLEKSYLSIH